MITAADLIEAARRFPDTDSPETFGLEENAIAELLEHVWPGVYDSAVLEYGAEHAPAALILFGVSVGVLAAQREIDEWAGS